MEAVEGTTTIIREGDIEVSSEASVEAGKNEQVSWDRT
jgi:hypothetical protein